MDTLDRKRLIQHRMLLMDTLDVDDILPLLRQEFILDENHEERIRAEITRKDKVRKLLDMLPLRGGKAYQVFHQAVSAQYNWIVPKLDNADSPEDAANNCGVVSCETVTSVTETPQKVLKEITSGVLLKVAKHPAVLNDWKMLSRSLGLNESDIIEVQHDEQQSVREAAYQALRKWQVREGRAATSSVLIAAIRANEIMQLADELEKELTI